MEGSGWIGMGELSTLKAQRVKGLSSGEGSCSTFNLLGVLTSRDPVCQPPGSCVSPSSCLNPSPPTPNAEEGAKRQQKVRNPS